MIKLEKDGTTSGRVLVGDNYHGLCCDGFDCTVYAVDVVSDGDVWLHCDGEVHHGEQASGDYYAGELSKQVDNIVQHLADAEVPTYEHCQHKTARQELIDDAWRWVCDYGCGQILEKADDN